MKKPIYAFYQPNLSFAQHEEFNCSNLWKTSWSQNGWEPTMLNSSHSKSHKLYDKLAAKLATEIKSGKHVFPPRYLRWCALSMAGGGWMSDYDVVNVGLEPEICEALQSKANLHINTGRHAYIFYATKDQADAAVLAFIENDLTSDGSPIPEAIILRKTNKSLSKAIGLLWHPNTSEPARSVQMAEWIDLEKPPIMLVP